MRKPSWPLALALCLAAMGSCSEQSRADRSGAASAQAVSPSEVAKSAPILRRVLPPRAPAVDVRTHAGHVLVATRGLGAFQISPTGNHHWDVGELPSSVATQVAFDALGTAYVGTERGVVRLGDAPVELQPTDRRFRNGRVEMLWAAGDVLWALSSREAGEGTQSQLFRVKGTELTPARDLPSEFDAMAHATDTARGCAWLAGLVPAGSESLPAVVEHCGRGRTREIRALAAPPSVLGVAAVAANQGGAVLILVQESPRAHAQRASLWELDVDGELTPHCAHAALGGVPRALLHSGEHLWVAVAGRGVLRVGCESTRILSDDPRLHDPWALAADDGGLLVGTTAGLYRVSHAGKVDELLALEGPPADLVPSDIRPDGTVLAYAEREGIFELHQSNAGWDVAQRYSPADEKAVFGAARYLHDGDIAAIQRSRGLLRIGRRTVEQLAPADEVSAHPLHIAATDSGVWAALGTAPMSNRSAGLQFYRRGGGTVITLADPQLAAVGALLAWPAEGRVWAGTRLGVIEARVDGTVQRLSKHSVNALYHHAASGAVAAVGSTVERWDGKRFRPMLFASPGLDGVPLGHPTDVVIDRDGRWLVLYSSGRLAVLDASGRLRFRLGPREGVPATTRALLYHPHSNQTWLGTLREGIFAMQLPAASAD